MSIGDLFLDLNLNTKPFDMQMKNVGSYAQKSMKRSFGGFNKILAGALSTAAVVSFGKSCLELGSDLSEVQNVVDVTFPNMNAQINNFAKNAIGKFGLSETVAKRMTGTYGSMAKAFGFSEKAAYDMATSLTGLAGDVASFYNLDPSEAYTKLKSVFSGETETLKDLGVVMTQNALDQYAMANGFGKTTAKMTEQEKVALRLQFVTEQLSAAGGDFARTSDSWANKVRVLSLNFQSLKATLGQGFINILSPLISLLNNLITKLNTAATYFTAFTSLLSGNKKTSSTLGSVSGNIDKMTKGTANLSNNVGSVGKAAKKAVKEMGALAGFDEIINISKSNSSDDGASGGGSSAGMGDFDMSGVNDVMNIDTSNMENALDKMQTKWNMFTDFLVGNKEIILSVIAGIGAGMITLGLLKFEPLFAVELSRLVSLFSNWQLGIGATIQALLGISAPAMIVVGGIAAVTASLVYLYQTSDGFRNLVNEAVNGISSILMNLWVSVLQPLFSFIGDVFATILIPLATFVGTVFVGAVQAIATVVLSFWNNILAPLVNFLVSVLSIALKGVIDIWIGWKPIIENIFNALNWLWKNMLSPFVGFLVGGFCDGFKEWGELIRKLIPDIKTIFQGLTDFIVGIFTLNMKKAWSGIQKIFTGFTGFLGTVFSTDWTKKIGALGLPLNSLLSKIQSIWNMIKGVFNGINTFISGVFTSNWKKAWSGVKNIFSSIISGIANIFKAPINVMIDGMNKFIGGLNKIKIPDWVPGVGGKGISIGKIPKLANGGYVKANTPQLAMIGDNKRYGEIVSPENKMFDVMMSALKEYGTQNTGNQDIQVLVSILYEILDAIKNLRLVVDGDSLNDDSKKRDRERALRTGKVILD